MPNKILKLFILLVLYGTGIIIILIFCSNTSCNLLQNYYNFFFKSKDCACASINNISNYLKIPNFDVEDIQIVNAINQDLESQSIISTIDKVTALNQLSSIIQKHLKLMETVKDCNQTTTLLCGHQDVCGFGCQVHHRMACVMLSYVLGIPLIHEKGGWPYSQAWNDVFEPIGSNCSQGSNTLKVRWRRENMAVTNNLITGNISVLLSKSHSCECNCAIIEYPFKHGIVVPEFIGNLVDSLHENPFVWWMGQFSKYVLKLRSNQQSKIEKWKQKVFPKSQTSPIIGMHIRRTDKADEAKLLPIEAYFKIINFNSSLFKQGSTRNIFIASDASHEILAEAKRKYNSSEWNILGFHNQTTIYSQSERANSLEEIIRDVYLLSECDYVVCTMSSQVCRVVLEIMSSKRMNSFSRVKSLDKNYTFGLCCGFAVDDPVVIKV